MTRKVVFLSYINFNDPTAGAARTRFYSKMLQAEGVENTLYSIYDFYGLSSLANQLNANKYIRFISYPLRLLMYVLSLKKFIKDNNVVFYLYPTTQVLLDYLVIVYLRLIKRKKIYLEVNEVRRYGQGVQSKSLKYYKYALHERLAKYFNGLVCISTNIQTYYKKYNQNTLRIPILTNTNVNYLNNCDYKKGKVFNIGFTGSVHLQKENLLVFFSALRIVADKGYDIKFNLYGPIYNSESFYKKVSSACLNNVVQYHGVVQQELLPQVMAKQDLLVLPRAENNQNKYGFSTKLSEYLVSGVPTLATDVSDNLTYLSNGKDCLVADFSNAESFAEEVEKLIRNYPVMAPKLADEAFATAKLSFHYGQHAKSFSQFLSFTQAT